MKSASASVVRPVDDQFYLVDRVNEIDGRTLPEAQRHSRGMERYQSRLFLHRLDADHGGTRFRAARQRNRAEGGHRQRIACQARAFPNQNPIGHRLGEATIVGVVKDSRYNGARDQPRPVLYHPLFQHGSGSGVPLGVCLLRAALRLPAPTCWTKCAGKWPRWIAICRSSAPGRWWRKPNNRC